MSKSFDSYKLTKTKPMALEQAKLSRFPKLWLNPLYRANALTFMGGSLYRASLGEEALPSREAEEKLIRCLDYYLRDLADQRLYYSEFIEVSEARRLFGVNWPRGIAPEPLSFALNWPVEVSKGEKLFCRVNELDQPPRVDCEKNDGSVFSLALSTYKRLLMKTFRRYEPKSKKKRSLGLAGKTSARKPSRRPSAALLYLRHSLRGENPLQETPTSSERCLL